MSIAEITRRITEHMEWCGTCQVYASCQERERLEHEAEVAEALDEAEHILHRPVRYRIEWTTTWGYSGYTPYLPGSEDAFIDACQSLNERFPGIEHTYRREP